MATVRGETQWFGWHLMAVGVTTRQGTAVEVDDVRIRMARPNADALAQAWSQYMMQVVAHVSSVEAREAMLRLDEE